MNTRAILRGALLLTVCVASTEAQDISIPDAGLNAAIRQALRKPTGSLTGADLLILTNLDASRRSITNTQGLEEARNLTSLDLNSNLLAEFSIPSGLTSLAYLNLSLNRLTSILIPSGLTNLTTLIVENNSLTNLTLPTDLASLNILDFDGNDVVSFSLPSALSNITVLDAGFNSLTNLSIPGELTRLATLTAAANALTNFNFPAGLQSLTEIDLSQNQLTSVAVPANMTNLLSLDLFFNQITNVVLPGDLVNLTDLDLDNNLLTHLDLPSNMVHLDELHIRTNQLADFTLPADETDLRYLDIGENQLTNVTIPAGLNHLGVLRVSGNKDLTQLALPLGLTNLSAIFLRFNQLTNLTLPPDLSHLGSLDVLGNQLSSLTFPPGLTNLTNLFLSGNLLANLTLPPDMEQLTWLVLDGNPLTALVLPEPLAAASLSAVIAALQSQGVSVTTYPLAIQLDSPRLLVAGGFELSIGGPPGVYSVLGSIDLTGWSQVGAVTNELGFVRFQDFQTNVNSQKFYTAVRQSGSTPMVFIPANTFTMGSPSDETGRSPDEGPQTTVTLSHSFWMAKYLVTQEDYLAVIGSNPSGFPGDLSRPVESVTWLDATNYCAKLTQLDLATGRIPMGSHYRLPTEAEWECAARAGTTTRFYYGDDPGETFLSDHAWYDAIDGATTHPVGQKPANAWGLYDMEGNVWEWCQDWYGPYPGGSEADPQGPDSNDLVVKVIRGGAWDAFSLDCRSARRMNKAVSPFISDFIIGFRVVLDVVP